MSALAAFIGVHALFLAALFARRALAQMGGI